MTFTEGLRGCAPELSEEQVAALEAHYGHLARWNRVLNLTSIRSLEEIVARHYCESLFLARNVPVGPGESVIDVGSGAGFPGVPFAVYHPECRVNLVESHARKSVFLREATRGIGNVEVFNTRVEDARRHFSLLISRAVAWSDISKVVPSICDRVALLAGGRDAAEILKNQCFTWNTPVPLPGSTNRLLIVGST
jgi:16S rRNA (guanine527-N7)-methyltransferase